MKKTFLLLIALWMMTTPVSGQISLDNLLGQEVINIDQNAYDGGQISLGDQNGNVNFTITSKTGNGDGSGLAMFNQLLARTIRFDGNAIGQGGAIFLYDSDANVRMRFRAEESGTDSGAELLLYNSDNSGTLTLDPDNDGGGAAIFLRGSDDRLMASLKSADGPLESGGHLRLYNHYDQITLFMDGQNIGSGGFFTLRDSLGNNRVNLVAMENGDQGGSVKVFDQLNNLRIELDGDYNGVGRVITDELEIKGGADFAEHFEISNSKENIRAGMAVSIDPNHEGRLRISEEAYDTKVAGILSGANGISSGVIMYQNGSLADGQYPIALTGRVYALVNNENGPISPGDLLTTSSQPGTLMRATKRKKMRGAIVGKALTHVDEHGFVLVLVNLQ